MATTQSGSEADSTVSKDVTIVAYLKADPGLSEREVFAELDDQRDYYSRSVKGDPSKRLWVGGDRHLVSSGMIESFEGRDTGEAVVVTEAVRETSYDNGSWEFRSAFRSGVIEDMPDTVCGDMQYKSFYRRYERDSQHVIKTDVSGPVRMGLLKHKTEASPDDMWADEDADMWAMTLTVSIQGVNEQELDEIDTRVSDHLYRKAAGHEWVQRVRVMDCEKHVTEKGVCYDL